ncbi:MAG: RluA family pseudouridine synthase [bacterium]
MKYLYRVAPGGPVPLDRFLQRVAPFGLNRILDLIDFGSVWVGGRAERKPSRVLQPGDEVTLNIPSYGTERFYAVDPSRILYRDSCLLAYDKEPGIPSQATPYDAHNNVFAALASALGSAVRGGKPYIGLHHRLDQETSGVMLFSLSARANGAIAASFRERRVEKKYLAVVRGSPADEEWLEEAPITRREGRYQCCAKGEGREAVTRFRVLQRRAGGTALLEASPQTGRTHQIRLHLAHRGLPVLGDARYGGEGFRRLMLHAHRLAIAHPATGRMLVLEAPVPEEFAPSEGFRESGKTREK